MTHLDGAIVRLRPVTEADIGELVRIRETPEVFERWRGGGDLLAAVHEDLAEPDIHPYVIELDGRVVGWIQWQSEDEADYHHAGIDIYVDPAVHGRGLGTDAVRTIARHLVADHGHHRLTIDPAADNAAAIASYRKVGFRPVGVMRQAERGGDGTWHDSLLMDLLADELTDDREPSGTEAAEPPVEVCVECGFKYEVTQADDAGDQIVEAAADLADVLHHGGSRVRARREPGTWTALEYACHVRDVLLVQRERVLLARRTERPSPEAMGRDERVDHDGYAQQRADDVARQLRDAALLFAHVLSRLGPDDWDRTLVYHYPARSERSLRWVAVHTLHEVTHHLADARRQLER